MDSKPRILRKQDIDRVVRVLQKISVGKEGGIREDRIGEVVQLLGHLETKYEVLIVNRHKASDAGTM